MRDPENVRYVKKAIPARKKKWGLEQWNRWFGAWSFPEWYRTEKARDQAYDDFIAKTSYLRTLGHDLLVRKVNR